MRLRVRHLCLAVVVVAILAALAVNKRTDRYYCTCCGLLRLSEYRTCVGFDVSKSTQYRETEFHRLLLSTGGVECSHRWQAFYWNHHRIGPGEVPRPWILYGSMMDEDLWRRLAALEDHDALAAILTSFDLTEAFDEQQEIATLLPFKEFKAVKDAKGEREWWAKYRHLFVGRLPPDPAVTRIPPGRVH